MFIINTLTNVWEVFCCDATLYVFNFSLFLGGGRKIQNQAINTKSQMGQFFFESHYETKRGTLLYLNAEFTGSGFQCGDCFSRLKYSLSSSRKSLTTP